MFSKAQSYH